MNLLIFAVILFPTILPADLLRFWNGRHQPIWLNPTQLKVIWNKHYCTDRTGNICWQLNKCPPCVIVTHNVMWLVDLSCLPGQHNSECDKSNVKLKHSVSATPWEGTAPWLQWPWLPHHHWHKEWATSNHLSGGVSPAGESSLVQWHFTGLPS